MHETLALVAEEIGVPVQMRVGVNTGEVLVGAMRAGGESTVMGDVVNTAQRLQTVADPGEVIVGSATYAATRECVEYEALGLLTVRGRDEPIEAYRAVTRARRHRAAAAPGDARRSSAATTRSSALRHVLEMASGRNRAQLVLLYGDAGVGKSRLANEISRSSRARSSARACSFGQCVPYGDTNVFGPVAEVLREACGIEGIAAARRTHGCTGRSRRQRDTRVRQRRADPSCPKTSTARRMRVNGSSKASCT